MTQRQRVRTAPWLAAALLLLAWYLVKAIGRLPEFILPGPWAVAVRLAEDITGPVVWPYVWLTVAESLGGCLVGAASALPLAVLIHRSRWFRAAVTPFLGATQAIPAVALAPLLVIWVGYGLWPVVLLCALLVFFPILVATVVGLRHLDQGPVDAARLDGAGSWALLTEVELPLALPSILGGLRNGFALSVTGAVVGEMVMGGQGLGSLLTLQRDAVDTAGMFATITILCLLASSAYGLILVVERRSSVMDALTPAERNRT